MLREHIQRLDARRHSTRLITTWVRVRNHAAVAAEREAWVEATLASLLAEGYPCDGARGQVLDMVDDALIGIVPVQARG